MISTESAADKYKDIIDRAARRLKDTRYEPVPELVALGGASVAGAGYATNRNNITWASGIAGSISYSLSVRIDLLKDLELEEYEEKIGTYEEALEDLGEDPFKYLEEGEN